MKTFYKYLLLGFLAISILYWIKFNFKLKRKRSIEDLSASYYSGGYYFSRDYAQICLDLYKTIRFNDNIFIPPVKAPPTKSIAKEFEQDGLMPILSYSYFDNSYNLNKNVNLIEISNKELTQMTKMIKNKTYLSHGPKIINQQLEKFADIVEQSHVLVFGSDLPWAETIAFNLGASKISTLEFNRKIFENRKIFKWWHMFDYLDMAMKETYLNELDLAISYSKIESFGLGRHGEALSPYGDLEALKMIHCLLKPKGILFLGLPLADGLKGFISFNSHRVYGSHRLNMLFQGWKILDAERSDDHLHTVFILQKD